MSGHELRSARESEEQAPARCVHHGPSGSPLLSHAHHTRVRHVGKAGCRAGSRLAARRVPPQFWGSISRRDPAVWGCLLLGFHAVVGRPAQALRAAQPRAWADAAATPPLRAPSLLTERLFPGSQRTPQEAEERAPSPHRQGNHHLLNTWACPRQPGCPGGRQSVGKRPSERRRNQGESTGGAPSAGSSEGAHPQEWDFERIGCSALQKVSLSTLRLAGILTSSSM